MKKIIGLFFILLLATSCTKYKIHFGKACTPDNREWSYIWFVEKGGENVSKANCKLEK